MTDTVTMPKDPPADLSDPTHARDPFAPDTPYTTHGVDEVLFDLCRRDDYHGLYREFVRRYGVTT